MHLNYFEYLKILANLPIRIQRGSIRIQAIFQAVPNQRHGLNLVHIGVEETRDAKTLEWGADYRYLPLVVDGIMDVWEYCCDTHLELSIEDYAL